MRTSGGMQQAGPTAAGEAAAAARAKSHPTLTRCWQSTKSWPSLQQKAKSHRLYQGQDFLQRSVHFGGAGLRPVFAQGQDLTRFRRCRLCTGIQPVPRALPPPLPSAPPQALASLVLSQHWGSRGPMGTVLRVATGSRQAAQPSAGLTRTARASAAGMCCSTQRLRAPLQGSFLQVSRVEQSQGIEAFLTLSILALWEQNKWGFGMSNANVYLHMHTIGRVFTSAE